MRESPTGGPWTETWANPMLTSYVGTLEVPLPPASTERQPPPSRGNCADRLPPVDPGTACKRNPADYTNEEEFVCDRAARAGNLRPGGTG
jgi:hypothetical protein